jgi:hypothetical protein
MLNVVVLTVAFIYCYAECHYAECRYAEYHGAALFLVCVPKPLQV